MNIDQRQPVRQHDEAALYDAAMSLGGRSDEELSRLASIAGLPPTSAGAAHLAGVLLINLGRQAEALPWLQRALARDASVASYYNDLGVCLFGLGRKWQAMKAFAAAIAIDADHASAAENLQGLTALIEEAADILEISQRHLDAGDFNMAETLVRGILATIPDHIEALLFSAQVLEQRGEPEAALGILEQVLNIEPFHPAASEILDRLTAMPKRHFIVSGRVRFPRPRCEAEEPLVSVTVLSFNQARYIRECLDSVLAQTWSPLEIIIGDDGSTDGTADIIQSRLDRYRGPHRIEFFRHERNLGLSGAVNWRDACRRTRGEFIVEFSGDDVMYPDMVESMVRSWQTTGASLVAANAEFIDAESRSTGRTRLDPSKTPEVSVEILARDGVNDCVFGAGLGMDRRFFEAFPRCSGNPPLHLATQDILFPFLAGFLGGSSVVSKPLMRYRIHSAQHAITSELDGETDAFRRCVIEERMWQGHLSHAFYMMEVLRQVIEICPERYQSRWEKLAPAISQQILTMAARQVAARKRLFYEFGVREVVPAP